MLVEMFFSPYCPYCRRAQSLLESKGVSITIYDVDAKPDLWEESKRRSGRNTVPQIFINDRHVGGCDDLHALEAKGELATWLADATTTA